MNLGQAIKMCRSRRGLSQTELAKRAGCSISYLSLLEKSNSSRDPTMSMVEKISLALNVPISILFLIAADKGELSGLDKALTGQLVAAALDLLSEQDDQPTLL